MAPAAGFLSSEAAVSAAFLASYWAFFLARRAFCRWRALGFCGLPIRALLHDPRAFVIGIVTPTFGGPSEGEAGPRHQRESARTGQVHAALSGDEQIAEVVG